MSILFFAMKLSICNRNNFILLSIRNEENTNCIENFN